VGNRSKLERARKSKSAGERNVSESDGGFGEYLPNSHKESEA
jgi:hypothetical protein